MRYLQSYDFARGQFPEVRLRRNRLHPWIRRLVAQNTLSVDDLILPLFIRNTTSQAEIPSMPGIQRYTVDEIIDFVGRVHEANIPAIHIFPYYEPERRHENVIQMLTPENMYCEAIRRVKKTFPDVGIIVDVALDCYTTHGQDGIVRDGHIVNDETVKVVSDYAVILAQAGADIIAPSEMMDGRVRGIRRKLDISGFQDVGIMSYAAKYASNFYGPFRDAVGSKTCLAQADKNTYQMDFRNRNEALREVALDIAEGADTIMVKPALLYLDIVRDVKETFGMPTFAYQVSGEYSMLKAAFAQGWLDYNKCLIEILLACKRAGADGILTYAALEAAQLMKQEG